jgi:hypothetical protein
MTTKTKAANPSSDPGAAPAPATGSALMLGGSDELAGLALDEDALADDGLAEVNRDDIRIATLAINFKGLDKSGRGIPADSIYNTLDEVVLNDVDAALLLLRKTRLYSVYIEAEKKSDVVCRSFDNIKGTMADGTVRPCEGCPDNEWMTKPDGKRARHCSPVYNVFGIDRRAGQLFMMRFKKTSLDVVKSHLQKHHIGRRRLPTGKNGNYPLYVFNVRLTAKMAGPKATHALPVIEKIGVLPAAEITAYAEALQTLQAQTDAVIDKSDKAPSGGEPGDGGGDASFGYGANDKYAADAGQDFVGGGGGDAKAKAS